MGGGGGRGSSGRGRGGCEGGQTGLAANFRQTAPEIHASLVSPLFPSAPAGEIAFGGDLVEFAVALVGPLGEAALLQALEEAAAAAGFEHDFLLFAELFRGLDAEARGLGFL